ncbi:MAG TPA: hypothetical protein VFT82_03235 [Candidatus Paceibacterota bacterium]|nr:hypothetical protein [Candidatus Paceibacterota bacterium]
MKKIASIFIVLSILSPMFAYAAGQTTTGGQTTGGAGQTTGGNGQTTGGQPDTGIMNAIPNPLNGVNSISDLIYQVVQVVVDFSYVIIAFFLLLSGFKFITAQGSDSKLEDAKKTFFYTIIGAALVIGAQVIVSVLQSVFKGLSS